METQNDELEKGKKIITPENFAEVENENPIVNCIFEGDFLEINNLFKSKKFINCKNSFNDFFFEECCFENCKFQHCKFENCTFAKENELKNCDFEKCDFQNAKILQKTINCHFHECDFSKIIFNENDFQKILHDQKIKINNITSKKENRNPKLFFCTDFEICLQNKIDGFENEHVFLPIIFELQNGQKLKVLAQTYFTEDKRLSLIFLENYLFENEITGEEQKIWENVIYTPGKNFLPIAEKEIIDPSTKYFESGNFNPEKNLPVKKIFIPKNKFSVRINRPVQEIETEEILENIYPDIFAV